MEKSKGLVTIPTDLDVVPQTLELMKLWGADAIRDCDGKMQMQKFIQHIIQLVKIMHGLKPIRKKFSRCML